MGLKFEQQMAFEHEGAAAALCGLSAEKCPYPPRTSEAIHWSYGWQICTWEKETIARGTIEFCSTGETPLRLTMPVAAAIQDGHWKPRYLTPETAFTTLPTSSGKKP